MPKIEAITLTQLLKEVREKELPFLVEPESKTVVVWKLQDENGTFYEEAHIGRIFKIQKDGMLLELDFEEMKEEIAEYLKDHVPVKAFLKDVLTTKRPDDVIELLKRVRKKGKVTADEGCFILNVGGKRGFPFQLDLRK